jgi:antirestriction protein ArdC
MFAFTSGDPRWMTYQQAAEKKWQVREGEKSTTIFLQNRTTVFRSTIRVASRRLTGAVQKPQPGCLTLEAVRSFR